MKSWLVVVVALTAAGCGKKSESEGPTAAARPKDAALAPPADAVAIILVDAAVVGDASAPANDPLATEKRYEDCTMAAWSPAKPDVVKACYAPTARVEQPNAGPVAQTPDAIAALAAPYRVAFPDLHGELQLVLVQGTNAAAIALLTGTHKGNLSIDQHELAATQKKLGIWTASAADLDAGGHIDQAWQFIDLDGIVGQLQDAPGRPVVTALPHAKEVVIATGDPREAANRITVLKFLDAISKHDRRAVAGFLADGLVWSEAPLAEDLDKTKALDRFAALWKGFSKLSVGAMTAWSAGDYTVAIETMTGTNDGALALPDVTAGKTGKRLALPMLAIYKFDHDKITNAWVHYAHSGWTLTAPPAQPAPTPKPAKK